MELEPILIPSSSPVEPEAPYTASEASASSKAAHSLIENTDQSQLVATIKQICKTDGAFALTILENLNTNPSKLVETVKSISKLDDSFNTKILQSLLLPPAENAAGPPADAPRSNGGKRKALSDVDLNTMGSGPIRKKFRSAPVKVKHALCTQCGEVFSSAENDQDACNWHDDELEVDDDKYDWPDHDEDCHGVIDSFDMRLEYPENFTWACCDEDGGVTDGCTTGRHASKGDKSEYAKLRLMGFPKGQAT